MKITVQWLIVTITAITSMIKLNNQTKINNNPYSFQEDLNSTLKVISVAIILDQINMRVKISNEK